MTGTDEDLAQLVERTGQAAAAFMAGDMDRFAALMPHTDDYTLMAPYGGAPRRGFDGSHEALAALARCFQSGEARFEIVQTCASGDLAVVVGIERQRGVVGGLPEQDWSLRVTLVFRRSGSGWQLAHRHADPLVHEISHEELAVLARGAAPTAP
jgi:ketosteroid isomerase-like protein